MSVDYIVASLPSLRFGEKPAISWEKFQATAGVEPGPAWSELEAEIRNALAEARAAKSGRAAEAEKFRRPVKGCSLYWRNRAVDAFKETDPAKRDESIDRVYWDAAEELTSPSDPLGRGALETYAVRLRIALKRAKISKDEGNRVFDSVTAQTQETPVGSN